jgi:ABC-type uncharacterized transport system substrate-binding protein
VSLTERRVLLLQSDGKVGIYRDVAAAVAREIPATVSLQDCNGDPDRCGEVASAPADVVVAIGALAARALAGATRPAIACALLNPGDSSAPGVAYYPSAGQQLRTIKAALPGRTRIGVIYNPERSRAYVAAAEQAAAKLGLRLVEQAATKPQELGFLFRTLQKEIDVLWLIPDQSLITTDSFLLLAELAAESKVPLVGFAEAFARGGAVLAIYSEPAVVGSQCARLAIDALRGGVLGGTQDPERVSCAVNSRIEDQLGLNVPPGVCRAVTP